MNTPHLLYPVSSSLGALWSWLMAQPGQRPAGQNSGLSRSHASACAPKPHSAAPGMVSECHPGARPALRRPVRVLRVLEAGQSPAQAGRLRISGCMADVCAELDRLAAHEALLH
jgi:hypothetical protein